MDSRMYILEHTFSYNSTINGNYFYIYDRDYSYDNELRSLSIFEIFTGLSNTFKNRERRLPYGVNKHIVIELYLKNFNYTKFKDIPRLLDLVE